MTKKYYDPYGSQIDRLEWLEAEVKDIIAKLDGWRTELHNLHLNLIPTETLMQELNRRVEAAKDNDFTQLDGKPR